MATLASLTALRRLHLSHRPFTFTDAGMAQLSQLTRLTNLRLSGGFSRSQCSSRCQVGLCCNASLCVMIPGCGLAAAAMVSEVLMSVMQAATKQLEVGWQHWLKLRCRCRSCASRASLPAQVPHESGWAVLSVGRWLTGPVYMQD